MKKLKLPDLRAMPRSHKALPMDDYLAFVQFVLGNVPDREASRAFKNSRHVTARFRLVNSGK